METMSKRAWDFVGKRFLKMWIVDCFDLMWSAEWRCPSTFGCSILKDLRQPARDSYNFYAFFFLATHLVIKEPKCREIWIIFRVLWLKLTFTNKEWRSFAAKHTTDKSDILFAKLLFPRRKVNVERRLKFHHINRSRCRVANSLANLAFLTF